MKRVRIHKPKMAREHPWREALPADPRDPDVLRASLTAHPVSVPGTRLLLIGSPMDSAGFAGLAGTLADRRGPGGQAQHC